MEEEEELKAGEVLKAGDILYAMGARSYPKGTQVRVMEDVKIKMKPEMTMIDCVARNGKMALLYSWKLRRKPCSDIDTLEIF